MTWEQKSLYRLDAMEKDVSEELDAIFNAQEQLMLGLLEDDSVKALMSIGEINSLNAAVPITALTVASQPLALAMDKVYEKAITDNIEEGYGSSVSDQQAQAAVSEHMSTVNNYNSTTQQEVVNALVTAASIKDSDGGDVDIAFKLMLAYSLVKTVFNKLRSKRKPLILDSAIIGPYNQGLYDSVSALPDRGASLTKQWVSLKDERVRASHKALHGDKVPVQNPFFVGGVAIRFPKDPLAPPAMTINCRCVLKFGK